MTNAHAGGGQPTLPKFGAVQNRAKCFVEHGFDIEMYKCLRAHYTWYQEVRILHVSTYLDGAGPEMRKIKEHMNGEGFVVYPKRHPYREFHPDYVSSDVLLLGCDSHEVERARKILLEVERGLLGIWRWDILWYFADGRVPSDVRLHTGASGCSNDEFSADAISRIRAHIDRRYDSTAQAGLPVKLAHRLEKSIDRVIRPKGGYDTLSTRLTRLEKRATNIKGCRDWKLFIATADFIAAARDYLTHPHQSSAYKHMMEEWENFKDAARNHAFLMPPCVHEEDTDISNAEMKHSRLKVLTLLVGMAKSWLDECDKDLWAESESAAPCTKS